MATSLDDSESISIPRWVIDHESFRKWFHSPNFPKVGRISFLNEEIWLDLSKEQFYTHNQVKGEYARVLGTEAKRSRKGRFIPDGMLLTNLEIGLSTVPDGAYFFHESLKSDRIRLIEGVEEGFVELEGCLDMALEVVSASSVEKDCEFLMDLYWRAGITEYWLVDARAEAVLFDIYRHGLKGYRQVRKQGGWIKSQVLGKSFKFTVVEDDAGNPDYLLEIR